MENLQVKPPPNIYLCGIIEGGKPKILTDKEREDLKNRACSNLQDENTIVICTDELPPLLRF